MAIVLLFKQGDSGTSLSLNSATAGFSLAGNGWNPAVATPVHMGDPAPIAETIHLRLKNSSQDNLATNMQSLHEMQVLADRYINDPHQEAPVWLHAKMANETGERRALVYSISAQYKTSWFGEPATAIDIPLVLRVVRGPYWENTTVRNLPDGAPSAAACVVYDYTAAGDVVGAHDIVGDVGARLRFFDIDSGNTHRHWMGIRSAGKHGADGVAQFGPIWELEDGTNNAAENGITDEGDATASDGNMVEVTENQLDWDAGTFLQVCRLTINNVQSGHTDHQFGNYLWLMRAKVDSGIWEAKLYIGNTIPSYAIERDIVEISDTDWRYYEMGIAPITDRDLHAILPADIYKPAENSFSVYPFARRTSGSGDLNVDCLIPIPIDEGFCKTNYAGTANHAIGNSPEGTWSAQEWNDSGPTMGYPGSIKSIENFVLPPGDGRVYCVYERDGSSVIGDTITFNQADVGRYYERWLSLRGSE